MPPSSESRQICPTSRANSSPEFSSTTSFRSSGSDSQTPWFMEIWNVVVPKRSWSGPSIWYCVSSWIFSAGMISQGISAPSTAPVESACGRSGTGMPTGWRRAPR